MANANLTATRLREILHYNPDTGLFTRLVSLMPRWHIGEVAGSIRKIGNIAYVLIKVDGKLFLAHRLAWLYMTGKWPEKDIDHKDGDGGNNRWANLRDVSKTINLQNTHKTPAGKKYSALFGAHWCKKRRRWKSSIRVNGKNVYIGWFDTDVEASQAYLEAKRKYHEGCTI
jgi:HNH endonuclease